MNELNGLEERLKSALQRVEAAVSAEPKTVEVDTNVDGLLEENAKLKADLATLKNERHADMKKLDGLIAKIAPLLEKNNA